MGKFLSQRLFFSNNNLVFLLKRTVLNEHEYKKKLNPRGLRLVLSIVFKKKTFSCRSRKLTKPLLHPNTGHRYPGENRVGPNDLCFAHGADEEVFLTTIRNF